MCNRGTRAFARTGRHRVLSVWIVVGWLAAASSAMATPPHDTTPAPVRPVAALSNGDQGGQAIDAKTGKKAEPQKPLAVKETLSAVGDIARDLNELKTIDKRLAGLEKSVAGIDASLVPVGEALRPERFRGMVTVASDHAYERGKALILFATACMAGLLVLGALLLRWSLSPRLAPRPAAPSPSSPKEPT